MDLCGAVRGVRCTLHQQPKLMDSCSREEMERGGAAIIRPLLSRRNRQVQKQTPKVVVQTENSRRKALSAATGGHQPESKRIITCDLARDLLARAPSEDPSGSSIMLPAKEYQRIKPAARVWTKAEREVAAQALQQQKEALIAGVNERKSFMRQKELLRKKNAKLSDLEKEAQRRAQDLLERANTRGLEEEEEIKELNQWILSSKCHAIRDAQTLEKKVITKEMAQEEKRLDHMMEVERRKAIKVQEEIEEKKRPERIRGKHQILQQIGENAESKILKEERRAQEAQRVRQRLEELQMEDIKDLERKRKERLAMREEMKRISAENEKKKKKEQKEQEKLLEGRVLECTRQRLAREAAFEEEKERMKKEREKAVARLQATQERATDYRAEQDALKEKRHQEAMDRAWRQKEMELAQREVETVARLKQSRLEQVAHKEHFLAVQAGRERAEFERVLRAQREELERERRDEEERTSLRRKHQAELRRQLQEKEQTQLRNRVSFLEGSRALVEAARERRARLDELKRKKLEELRMSGLPEKYCSVVARKAEVPTTVGH